METLCWECKKACGGCSWVDSFAPVKGWQAEKNVIPDKAVGGIDSYCVKACPEFTPDDKRIINLDELVKMVGHCHRKVMNMTHREIENKLAEKGYNVKYNYSGGYWYELRR